MTNIITSVPNPAIKALADGPSRVQADSCANAWQGTVVVSPLKLTWIVGMFIGTLLALLCYPTWDGVVVFLGLSAVTLCFGHSLGMHRKLIHGSYDCPEWLEKLNVYLATLVGLGGPATMTFTHDMRDWAQRQPRCHDYFAHRSPIWKDAFWQLCCDLKLHAPPKFQHDNKLTESRFYRYLQATSMLQQVPVAALLFILGGWGWLLWGVCARVATSMIGHWLVGYFAHNKGGQHWQVKGASVQGYDVAFCSLITFGECWHNNHHAFSYSANLGIYPGQWDPGWWVLLGLRRLGWVWNIQHISHSNIVHGERAKHLKAVCDMQQLTNRNSK